MIMYDDISCISFMNYMYIYIYRYAYIYIYIYYNIYIYICIYPDTDTDTDTDIHADTGIPKFADWLPVALAWQHLHAGCVLLMDP